MVMDDVKILLLHCWAWNEETPVTHMYYFDLASIFLFNNYRLHFHIHVLQCTNGTN